MSPPSRGGGGGRGPDTRVPPWETFSGFHVSRGAMASAFSVKVCVVCVQRRVSRRRRRSICGPALCRARPPALSVGTGTLIPPMGQRGRFSRRTRNDTLRNEKRAAWVFLTTLSVVQLLMVFLLCYFYLYYHFLESSISGHPSSRRVPILLRDCL